MIGKHVRRRGLNRAYLFVRSNRIREHHGIGLSRIPTVHSRSAIQLKRVMDALQNTEQNESNLVSNKAYLLAISAYPKLSHFPLQPQA